MIISQDAKKDQLFSNMLQARKDYESGCIFRFRKQAKLLVKFNAATDEYIKYINNNEIEEHKH